MGTVDLDAARAARAEAEHEEHTVKLGGDTFVLPQELPLEAFNAFRLEGVVGYVRVLMGDQWEKFLSHSPTLADITEMDRVISPYYGAVSLGESQASEDSSKSNGSRSRPTSNGSTASTSRKRSGAKRS